MSQKQQQPGPATEPQRMEQGGNFLTDLINGLHYSIGISTPSPRQVRMVAIIWLASMVVIVGVLFLLLRYAF